MTPHLPRDGGATPTESHAVRWLTGRRQVGETRVDGRSCGPAPLPLSTRLVPPSPPFPTGQHKTRPRGVSCKGSLTVSCQKDSQFGFHGMLFSRDFEQFACAALDTTGSP